MSTTTKKRERHTEACIGVLCLDPLAPVLAEEHVRRERTLGCLGVFLTSTAAGSFLGFLGRLACLRALNMSIRMAQARGKRYEAKEGVTLLTLDFVASLGI